MTPDLTVLDIELSRAFDSTYRAMEKLVNSGKVKHIVRQFVTIGVSNFSSPKINRLLQTAKIKPAVNQIECHAQWPQKAVVKLCQEKETHVRAFGPLGCTPIPALMGRHGPSPLEDKTVLSIVAKYAKTPVQVLLCYLLHRGISVIPMRNNLECIVENHDCRFDLADEDFRLLDTIAGESGELRVRNLESRDYLGFDNYNEKVEEA
ncbi:NADP-dependent oxidoreductase domain-containing protein [Podospora didyma]|uniref:NADP-dependent oxidoreductase domain-containing protein n=1 Tax=Podospora didyma TaxID=330526 RepID=A0AAE0N513_9PEZI|nr:NADP-dependent oxidoreductase domain-containing protein [Podospora didyma]